MYALLVALLLAPVPVKAVKPEFMRLTDKAFQVSVVRYQKDKKTVDLVGVVHVGDKAYYEKLNKLFTEYDAVCYELVAPKGTKVRKKGAGMFNTFIKMTLNLEHQLEIVNYDAKNFIHADLSFEDMKKKMESRGDTPMTIFLKTMLEMLQKKSMNKELDDFTPTGVKKYLASQMANQDGLGMTLQQLLVDDRNEAAMVIVEEQLKTKDKIAVFYGCAHNPDFDKRLQKLGFVPVEVTWHDAWNLEKTPQDLLLEALKKLLDQ